MFLLFAAVAESELPQLGICTPALPARRRRHADSSHQRGVVGAGPSAVSQLIDTALLIRAKRFARNVRHAGHSATISLLFPRRCSAQANITFPTVFNRAFSFTGRLGLAGPDYASQPPQTVLAHPHVLLQPPRSNGILVWRNAHQCAGNIWRFLRTGGISRISAALSYRFAALLRFGSANARWLAWRAFSAFCSPVRCSVTAAKYLPAKQPVLVRREICLLPVAFAGTAIDGVARCAHHRR